MLLDMINIEKVRRAIVYFGVMLLVLLVQNDILSHFTILGVHALIAPIAVVAVGFFEGGVWGGIFGLVLGFFSDMSLNGAPVLMTVLFPLMGFAAGVLTTFFMNKRLSSFVFTAIGALVLTAMGQGFSAFVFSDTDKLSVLLVAGLQCVLSLPFIFVVFYPCRRISGLDLSK